MDKGNSLTDSMQNIIISNRSKFDEIISNFKAWWFDKIHIVSDFDRTLTFNIVDWEERPSLISVLRKKKILWEDYSKKAYELYDYYHPIEVDPNIDLQIKKDEMTKWWNAHLDLLVQSKLNISDIEKAINSGIVKLRSGVPDFLKFLDKNNIPLVIISANWLGWDSMKLFLESHNLFFTNTYIESNSFIWDDNWYAIWKWSEVIHTFNKDEKILENNPFIFDKIKDRKNVILLWDSLWDVGMIDWFEYDNLLKIGFLNKEVERDLEIYKQNYDVVIINDSDFSFVNEIISSILQN